MKNFFTLLNTMLVMAVFSIAFSQEICDNGIDDDGDGLVDLNDLIDCDCISPQDNNILPNPSFEDYIECPGWNNSGIDKASDWGNGNAGSVDYYNTCNTAVDTFSNYRAPKPVPDGNGWAGYGTWPSSVSVGSKEYIETCLTDNILAGETYTFEFNIAQTFDAGGSANYELVLYGTSRCAEVPFAPHTAATGFNGNFTCLTDDVTKNPRADWVILGSATVPTPTDVWSFGTFTFVAPRDLDGIAIGPNCDLVTRNHYNMIDDLKLIPQSSAVGLEISATGALCSNDLILDAIADDPLGMWQWFLDGVALVGETAPSLQVSTNSYGLGKYTVRYTLAGECYVMDFEVIESEYELSFIVDCPRTVTFNITTTDGINIYDWDFGDGSISNAESPVHDYLAEGDFTVDLSLTNSTGCIITLDTIVTIPPIFSADFMYATLDFCLSDAAITPTINGTLGGAFTSSTAGLTLDGGTGEISPTTSTPGTYAVNYSVGPGPCPADSSLSITIFPEPTVDPMNDQRICIGNNFTAINFTGMGTTFNWTNTNPDIGLVASGTGNISSFLGLTSAESLSEATIEVTPSVNTCVGPSTTFELGINSLPVILFEGDVLEGCAPLTVNFSNLSPVPGDCLWDSGNGESTTTPNCSGASFTYDHSGVYDVTFSLTNAEGCTSTTQINNYINVTPKPMATFSMNPDKITSGQTTIEFRNSSTNATTYNWDFGDGTLSTKENPVHEFTIGDEKSRTITLWAHNPYCSDSIQNIIRVIEDLVFYVPNAFTPDGDGINQTFQPVFTSGFNPDDYHLIIFSRWGEVIFESFNSEIGWDGMYGNIGLVQDGVYTWKIVFADGVSDKKHERIGSVVLLK